MGKTSIKYGIRQAVLSDMKNNNSVKSYKSNADRFSAWLKRQGYKRFEQLPLDPDNRRQLLQAYCSHLSKSIDSPSTLHSRLAPACKAFGISMKAISKPKRTSDKIIRGRSATANEQGRREQTDGQYKRLVDLATVTGIRRAEYVNLRGRDLVRDESGYLCVLVERGKGGKEQLQRILPGDESVVKSIFHGVAPEQRVFQKQEVRNHIDLHSIRAKQAQRAYSYYKARLDTEPDYRGQLMEELALRYRVYHNQSVTAMKRFLADCQSSGKANGIYRLRGSNKEVAEANRRPVEYDRLALMAVSVFHLSHWRLDVTVTNYMIN